MADGMLQIDQRLDRIEKAIETMAAWLVEAQTGFGKKDYEGIVDILKDPTKSSVQAEAQGEESED